MTLKAVCGGQESPFAAGVALYGFSHGRWMTYETGDFTYEDEYDGPHTRWPVPRETIDGDVFSHMVTIERPLLMLHGQIDGICPPSQSRVVYHCLAERSIPTGLVEYPGEGHGFHKDTNRTDRDRRVLQWFLAHMPPQPECQAKARPRSD